MTYATYVVQFAIWNELN